jgi:hypothetical protein
MAQLPEITLDFNNSQADGLLFAKAQRASSPVEKGDRVLARDYEGNTCEAVVSSVQDGIVYLAPEWESWCGAEEQVSSRAGEVWITYSYASKRRRRILPHKRVVSHATGSTGKLVGAA